MKQNKKVNMDIVHDIDSTTNIYIDANIAIYNNLWIKIYDINTCHDYNRATAKLPTSSSMNYGFI